MTSKQDDNEIRTITSEHIPKCDYYHATTFGANIPSHPEDRVSALETPWPRGTVLQPSCSLGSWPANQTQNVFRKELDRGLPVRAMLKAESDWNNEKTGRQRIRPRGAGRSSPEHEGHQKSGRMLPLLQEWRESSELASPFAE